MSQDLLNKTATEIQRVIELNNLTNGEAHKLLMAMMLQLTVGIVDVPEHSYAEKMNLLSRFMDETKDGLIKALYKNK